MVLLTVITLWGLAAWALGHIGSVITWIPALLLPSAQTILVLGTDARPPGTDDGAGHEPAAGDEAGLAEDQQLQPVRGQSLRAQHDVLAAALQHETEHEDRDDRHAHREGVHRVEVDQATDVDRRQARLVLVEGRLGRIDAQAVGGTGSRPHCGGGGRHRRVTRPGRPHEVEVDVGDAGDALVVVEVGDHVEALGEPRQALEGAGDDRLRVWIPREEQVARGDLLAIRDRQRRAVRHGQAAAHGTFLREHDDLALAAAAPSATEPHFEGTAVISEPDGDLLGGEANASSTARMTVEISWELTGKPTMVIA